MNDKPESAKRKVARLIAERDSMELEGVLEQLDQMIEEMNESDLSAETVQTIWEDWTGLEMDYFANFCLEEL